MGNTITNASPSEVYQQTYGQSISNGGTPVLNGGGSQAGTYKREKENYEANNTGYTTTSTLNSGPLHADETTYTPQVVYLSSNPPTREPPPTTHVMVDANGNIVASTDPGIIGDNIENPESNSETNNEPNRRPNRRPNRGHSSAVGDSSYRPNSTQNSTQNLINTPENHQSNRRPNRGHNRGNRGNSTGFPQRGHRQNSGLSTNNTQNNSSTGDSDERRRRGHNRGNRGNSSSSSNGVNYNTTIGNAGYYAP